MASAVRAAVGVRVRPGGLLRVDCVRPSAGRVTSAIALTVSRIFDSFDSPDRRRRGLSGVSEPNSWVGDGRVLELNVAT